MTQERKCFVNPQDISAVRFQCSKCKAASIVPVERLIEHGSFMGRISRDCPYCQAPSGFTEGTREHQEFCYANVLLGKLTKLLEGRNIEFSFQVECAE
jgi:hypothetical protein